MADFIREHWDVIAAYPLTFILFAVVLIPIAVAVTRAIYGAAVEASRERATGAMEEVSRLRGEKSELLKKLEAHGESITEIKAELATVPRHFVSEESPPPKGDFREGDLWLQVDEKSPAQPDLSSEERDVLRILAQNPKDEFTAGELSSTLDVQEVAVEHHLERLEERGFVFCREVVDEPLRYKLDRAGREYVVKHLPDE